MKKALAVILSLFYLTAVSGIGMNFHYCCGRLDKVELSFTDAAGSSICPMHSGYKDGNCCKDVHKQLKITQPQNVAPDISFQGAHWFAVVLPHVPQVPSLYFSSVAKGSFSPHSPPFREGTVYLRNCSFLI